MKNMQGSIFLETKDFVKDLNMSNATVLNLFHCEKFPSFKLGRSWLVSQNAFNKLVETGEFKTMLDLVQAQKNEI